MSNYRWAVNQLKLSRAVQAGGDEFTVLARYRSLGGLVDEQHVPKEVEQVVSPVEQPVEATPEVTTVDNPVDNVGITKTNEELTTKPASKKTRRTTKKS